METYYLDSEYRVHLEQDADNTFTPWLDEWGVFDGKCAAYVKGHRVIPEGQTWTRKDGEVFPGLMITPIIDFATLELAQSELEEALELIFSGVTE